MSTASGGTLGYLLASQHLPLVFPPKQNLSTATYVSLSKPIRNHSDSATIWFANVVSVIPGSSSSQLESRPPVAQDWPDAIKALFSLSYKTPASALGYADADRPYLVNFAAVPESSCPIKRDPHTGWILDPPSNLVHGVVELTSPALPAPVLSGNLTMTTEGLTLVDYMAFSSMFMAASIVESQIQFDL